MVKKIWVKKSLSGVGVLWWGGGVDQRITLLPRLGLKLS
jgi:hypothetical protein